MASINYKRRLCATNCALQSNCSMSVQIVPPPPLVSYKVCRSVLPPLRLLINGCKISRLAERATRISLAPPSRLERPMGANSIQSKYLRNLSSGSTGTKCSPNASRIYNTSRNRCCCSLSAFRLPLVSRLITLAEGQLANRLASEL